MSDTTDATKTSNDHVLITPPDRYWSDAFHILLVDFEWGLTDSIINMLRSSEVKLAIHVCMPQDNATQWLLDVAAQCNIVMMDLNQTTNNDIVKGQIISKSNVWYTGRKDLQGFWPRHTDDPVGSILVSIDQYQQTP